MTSMKLPGPKSMRQNLRTTRIGTWKVLLTAMAEQERDSITVAALLMYEMDVQWLEAIGLDRGLEVGQLVELRFGLSPIEFILPVSFQALDVGQRGAESPARFVEFVWECRGG